MSPYEYGKWSIVYRPKDKHLLPLIKHRQRVGGWLFFPAKMWERGWKRRGPKGGAILYVQGGACMGFDFFGSVNTHVAIVFERSPGYTVRVG